MTSAETGIVLDANRATLQLHGSTRETFVGTVHPVTPPPPSPGRQRVACQVTGGEHFEAELDYRRVRWDGEPAWLITAASVDPAGLEIPLRLSQQALTDVAETLPGALFRYRLRPDGTDTVEYMSPACLELWEIDAESICDDATALWDLIHPDDMADMVASVQRSAEEESDWTHRWRITTPSGKRKWLEGQGRPHRLEDGSTVWHSFILDVTDRVAAEQTHEDLREQLRNVQKLESIGRLAGGVAHDFNNILMVINGNVDMALARDDLGSSRRLLEHVRLAAERAASITGHLLAFSRQQPANPRVIDLNQVVKESSKLLRRLLGEDIRLLTELDPDLGSVSMDPHQAVQVIMNLAVNARDAMPGGGQLTFETRNRRLDGEDVGLEPGHYIELHAADTGCGMDGETLTHIFEPFFTTKAEGEGTGLGLSTAYGIVLQNGGHIDVVSAEGQGATFRILLPRVADPVDTDAHPPEVELPRGSETVLVVEDEHLVLELVQRGLEALGYEVLVAKTARQGLSRAAEHDGPIHLLLSDVVLPDQPGPELAARIAESRPDMSIVFMSGYPRGVSAQRPLLEEGMQYLEKPFLLSELAVHCRDVLDGTA